MEEDSIKSMKQLRVSELKLSGNILEGMEEAKSVEVHTLYNLAEVYRY
jgi:hypothetical protein